MAFYLRKSLKVGPLRFNLSSSGIGVSGGVKGFRVGTGPRGNYIHMGRGGLYYRATLPALPTRGSVPRPRASPQPAPAASDGLSEIESGAVEGMTHSSSAALLAEIREKRALVRLLPLVLVVGGVVWLGLTTMVPLWASFLLLLLLIGAAFWTGRRDTLRKTVVLMYDFEPEMQAGYQALHDGFDWLANAHRAWHMEAQGATRDWKRQAGATSLIRRSAIALRREDPADLKTNIAIPSIPVGRQTLYFLPDRVLVVDRGAVGAIGYEQLELKVTSTRFIEEEAVPKDSELVGATWKYVNKKGGPDRRFKDNRELPIVLYGEIRFASSTGLNEALQVSNQKAAECFETGVRELAETLALACGSGRRDGDPLGE